MSEFFRAVGFPESLIMRAVADYECEFMRRYRPRAFPGIEETLATLHKARLKLGLVTANTRANVVPTLAHVIGYFEDSCQFFYDRYPEPPSKSWCLAAGTRLLSLAPSQCIYVGDQPADADAAKAAEFQFLGVSYGWSIKWSNEQLDFAESVRDIADRLTTPALISA